MYPKRLLRVSYRLMLWPLLLCIGMGVAQAAPAQITNLPAASEIRHESNGYWLYLDGKRKAALAGAVYQHTQGQRHVQEH